MSTSWLARVRGAPSLRRWRARWRGWLHALREIGYGMTGYEFAQHARHLRAEHETLLFMITFGDVIGLPLLPSYYSLRLLPYAVADLERWKRRVLRERHPLENEEYDLIEL
jgi:hypothetical protein